MALKPRFVKTPAIEVDPQQLLEDLIKQQQSLDDLKNRQQNIIDHFKNPRPKDDSKDLKSLEEYFNDQRQRLKDLQSQDNLKDPQQILDDVLEHQQLTDYFKEQYNCCDEKQILDSLVVQQQILDAFKIQHTLLTRYFSQRKFKNSVYLNIELEEVLERLSKSFIK